MMMVAALRRHFRQLWRKTQVGSYQRLEKWYLIPLSLTLVSRVEWSNPGKVVAPSPTRRCSSHWEGSLQVTLDYSRQLYFMMQKVTSLSLFNTIQFCQYLGALDEKTDKFIQSKHNILTRFIDKRYSSSSNIFDLKINNLSNYTLNDTEKFVLKHELEFCVLHSKINRERALSKFEVLYIQLFKHKPTLWPSRPGSTTLLTCTVDRPLINPTSIKIVNIWKPWNPYAIITISLYLNWTKGLL